MLSRVREIAEILKETDEVGRAPKEVSEAPGIFLREMYEQWVLNGGLRAGKNRNSIRQMTEWLSDLSVVKSLHPKLDGRVKITRSDARALVNLFLNRWRYVPPHRDTKSSGNYEAFPSKEITTLADRLVDAMFPVENEKKKHRILLAKQDVDSKILNKDQASPENWKDIYKNCDGLIILSRHQSVMRGLPTNITMKRFWQILDGFNEISAASTRNRVLIWIVDMGSRQVEDDEAWLEFANAQYLKAQFEAFAIFDTIQDSNDPSEKSATKKIFDDIDVIRRPDSNYRMERWNTLCDQSVVIVHSLKKNEIVTLNMNEEIDPYRDAFVDIGISPNNFLPREFPSSWRQITQVHSDSFEDAADAAFTVSIKKIRGEKTVDAELVERFDLTYSAYGLNQGASRSSGMPSGSSIFRIDLNSPGNLYDRAFRLAFRAACHRLKRDEIAQDGAAAAAYLRYLGFEVLLLPEFLDLFRPNV